MSFKARMGKTFGKVVEHALVVAFACAAVFGVVHLFRLFNTGRLLVKAAISFQPLIQSIIWPALILVLVVAFREEIKAVLTQAPSLLANYLQTQISHANSTSSDDESSDRHSPQELVSAPTHISKLSDKDESNEPCDPNRKDANACQESPPGGKSAVPPQRRRPPTAESLFIEYVLSTIENETGIVVSRNVTLFSNKTVRFDGAMIREKRIVGIEVHFGDQIRRKLQRYSEFFRSLSSRDKELFELLFCYDGDPASVDQMQHFRDCVPFPLSFRAFPPMPEMENLELKRHIQECDHTRLR